MIDFAKKLMLAGVGVAVVTKDKIEETLNEMVEKGKITRDEAGEITDKIISKGEEETEKAKSEANKLFNELLHRANVVTREQLESLEKRVTELEGRLHKEFPNEGG